MKRGFFLAGAIGAGVLPGGRTALVAQTTARPAPFGVCGYRSARTGRFYVFVTDEKGRVEQHELNDAGGRRIAGTCRRRGAAARGR